MNREEKSNRLKGLSFTSGRSKTSHQPEPEKTDVKKAVSPVQLPGDGLSQIRFKAGDLAEKLPEGPAVKTAFTKTAIPDDDLPELDHSPDQVVLPLTPAQEPKTNQPRGDHATPESGRPAE